MCIMHLTHCCACWCTVVLKAACMLLCFQLLGYLCSYPYSVVLVCRWGLLHCCHAAGLTSYGLSSYVMIGIKHKEASSAVQKSALEQLLSCVNSVLYCLQQEVLRRARASTTSMQLTHCNSHHSFSRVSTHCAVGS